MTSPYAHASGLPGVYDRTPARPNWNRVLFREGEFAQATDHMDAHSIVENRGRRVGALVARDGDRIEGAEIIVNVPAGSVTMTAGKVYLRGDIRAVPTAVLSPVPMVGAVRIGVRIITTVITEEGDDILLGLHPGTPGEGERGAAREAETVVWGFEGDGGQGDLFSVYSLKDGVPVDQAPPPQLTGFNQAIAVYDREANGNYITDGCLITALGKIGADQHFAISEGTANIMGFKRTRYTALRHVEPETPDLDQVDAEPHTYPGVGQVTIPVNHGPIASVLNVIITKETTQTIVRGAVNNTMDNLPNTSVSEVIEVKQGATTFVSGVDYTLNSDRIDWTLGGAEPAPGSSYNVKYHYLDAVVPHSNTQTSVTVSGGVNTKPVLISYTWKLPRIDLLCMDADGLSVYLKGAPARSRPMAPLAPLMLLPLAEITNNWAGVPEVSNTGVRSYHFTVIDRMYRRLIDALDLIGLERLRRDIDSREPVAKKGVWVDPFTSDRYRDNGVPQTAAIFGGTMSLAIDPTFYSPQLAGPVCLDFTDEIVIAQDLVTACMKINPYQNFEPLPGALSLTPSSDFWTEHRTEWTSPVTQTISGSGNGTSSRDELVDNRQQVLDFLREIPIAFTIKGFGGGEILDELTFDGIDVTPPGNPAANGQGQLTSTFTIPENVTAGQKVVRAKGMGGTSAEALFVGQGIVNIDVMRRVTTITRAPPSRPVISGRPPSSQSGGSGSQGNADPLAQTFTLIEPRQITAINLRFCAKGNPNNGCLVQIVTMENGWPTIDVVAESFVDMNTVVLNQWTTARFPLPVFLQADREFAFVVKTDDADHALSIARVGDFDAVNQKHVGAQPYSVGVMLSSSNARTWTAHQNEDITFQLVAAKFAPTTKTVLLGEHAVTQASDFLARAAVLLPTADARFHFEIERANGEITRLLPEQPWQLTEYITESVKLRGVLNGSQKISPILYPGVLLVAGKIRASGTYVSRAFAFGNPIRLQPSIKAFLPPGSTVAMEYDMADGNWLAVPLTQNTQLNDGWAEREYNQTGIVALEGRIRLTITGGPAARPMLSDLRAVSI